MEPKSKDQLIQELRERVYALEEIESDRDAIERELKSTRQRLQHLLAVSPAIIYTTKASGDFACTYVSENLQAIMGYTPEQMTTDPKCWPDHLHPEDARRILDECPRLVERGKGTLEYRFRRREGGYIWILDTPTGLRMGGEKRKMLMADLRGFTSLSERLPRNGSSLCSIATSPPWSPSSSNTRARSMSSSATPSSSSLALRSGKRTMHSARSPAG
jgi:PAS domain S-box-containing protein